jgi:hypothetical protein
MPAKPLRGSGASLDPAAHPAPTGEDAIPTPKTGSPLPVLHDDASPETLVSPPKAKGDSGDGTSTKEGLTEQLDLPTLTEGAPVVTEKAEASSDGMHTVIRRAAEPEAMTLARPVEAEGEVTRTSVPIQTRPPSTPPLKARARADEETMLRRDALVPPPLDAPPQDAGTILKRRLSELPTQFPDTVALPPRLPERRESPRHTPFVMISSPQDNLTRIVTPIPRNDVQTVPRAARMRHEVQQVQQLQQSHSQHVNVMAGPSVPPTARIALVASVLLVAAVGAVAVNQHTHSSARAAAPPRAVELVEQPAPTAAPSATAQEESGPTTVTAVSSVAPSGSALTPPPPPTMSVSVRSDPPPRRRPRRHREP